MLCFPPHPEPTEKQIYFKTGGIFNRSSSSKLALAENTSSFCYIEGHRIWLTFIPLSYALQNSVQMTRREKVFSFVEWAEAPLNLMGFPLFSEVSMQTAGQEIFFSSSFCWLLKQEKELPQLW